MAEAGKLPRRAYRASRNSSRALGSSVMIPSTPRASSRPQPFFVLAVQGMTLAPARWADSTSARVSHLWLGETASALRREARAPRSSVGRSSTRAAMETFVRPAPRSRS